MQYIKSFHSHEVAKHSNFDKTIVKLSLTTSFMTSYHQDMLYILNNNPWITEGRKGSFFDFDLLFCCAMSLSEFNALFAIISKIIKSNITVQSLIRIETLILSLIISAILKSMYSFKQKATVFDEDISAFEY